MVFMRPENQEQGRETLARLLDDYREQKITTEEFTRRKDLLLGGAKRTPSASHSRPKTLLYVGALAGALSVFALVLYIAFGTAEQPRSVQPHRQQERIEAAARQADTHPHEAAVAPIETGGGIEAADRAASIVSDLRSLRTASYTLLMENLLDLGALERNVNSPESVRLLSERTSTPERFQEYQFRSVNGRWAMTLDVAGESPEVRQSLQESIRQNHVDEFFDLYSEGNIVGIITREAAPGADAMADLTPEELAILSLAQELGMQLLQGEQPSFQALGTLILQGGQPRPAQRPTQQQLSQQQRAQQRAVQQPQQQQARPQGLTPAQQRAQQQRIAQQRAVQQSQQQARSQGLTPAQQRAQQQRAAQQRAVQQSQQQARPQGLTPAQQRAQQQRAAQQRTVQQPQRQQQAGRRFIDPIRPQQTQQMGEPLSSEERILRDLLQRELGNVIVQQYRATGNPDEEERLMDRIAELERLLEPFSGRR